MFLSSEKVRALLVASLIGSQAACGGGSPDPAPSQATNVPGGVQGAPIGAVDSAQGVTVEASFQAAGTTSGTSDPTASFSTAPSFDTKASFDTRASFTTTPSFTTNASFSTAPTFTTTATFSALPS